MFTLHSRKRWFLTGALVMAGLCATALCGIGLTNGTKVSIKYTRPPIDGPGMPGGAEWDDGTGKPDIVEKDPLSDDDMGDATTSDNGQTADAEIENKGGNLSGPNGVPQNGPGEGQWIEVKVRWHYHYYVTHTISFMFEGVGFSRSWLQRVDGTIESVKIEYVTAI